MPPYALSLTAAQVWMQRRWTMTLGTSAAGPMNVLKTLDKNGKQSQFCTNIKQSI